MYKFLIGLVTGPLMPFLEGIGKFFADQWMKMSYIKQGKQQQQMDDLKANEKNAEDAAKLKAGIDTMPDDELKQLLDGGRHKAGSNKGD